MNDESILNVAATIFSGLCASGNINSQNDENAKKYAFSSALQFAAAADAKSIEGLLARAGEVPFPT